LDAQIRQIEAILLDAVAGFRVPDPESFTRSLSTYLALHLPRGDEPSPRHERSLSGFNLVHRVPGLGERLAAAENLATTVDERLAANDRQAAGAVERIAGLDERLGGLGERFAGMDERLARLEAACDERLAAIEKRLATADERQGTLAQRVVNCEALLALVEDRFRRNEPLIRLIRPLAKYARKLPWLGIVVACWVRDAALVLPSLEGS
jgi:hypothetical protein